MSAKRAVDLIGAETAMLAVTGRCPGCGQPPSWDEETHGTSGPAQRRCVWAGCDDHHQALGVPVGAEEYAAVARAAEARGLTIDDYLGLRSREEPHVRHTVLAAARAAHPDDLAGATEADIRRNYALGCWDVALRHDIYGEVGVVRVRFDADGEPSAKLCAYV